MTDLHTAIQARRSRLATRISELAAEQNRRVDSFQAVELFLNSATSHAAYGEGYSLFGHMRMAGEAIPAEFGMLDSGTGLKDPDTRVVPFVRSYQFVAIVASLEDFVGQVLSETLQAYPQKVSESSIGVSALLEAASVEDAIAKAIQVRLMSVFYGSPKDQRKALESYLSMPTSVLDADWPAFVEMKARRDIGVHNNWRNSSLYRDRVSDAKGSPDPSPFLGISKEYLFLSAALTRRVVGAISSHCVSKFKASGAAETERSEP